MTLLSEEKKSCRKVLPGEPVATAEEYMAGFGTYEHDGVIYASAIGVLDLDEKNKVARLNFDNPPMAVAVGDRVFCEVTDARPAMVGCEIIAIEGCPRGVTGETEATIHVSRISNKYVEDASREYRITDIVRGEVVQARPSIQLTTAGAHYGVVFARCRNCRDPLERQQGNKLYCPKCDRTEYRKVADDYREVKF
ncbi:MAG: exosome complex RNA-binding protein Csl4 [Thermoplasmata archaeon]